MTTGSECLDVSGCCWEALILSVSFFDYVLSERKMDELGNFPSILTKLLTCNVFLSAIFSVDLPRRSGSLPYIVIVIAIFFALELFVPEFC